MTKASDGEEGLQQSLRHQPDIIVSDILMPRLSGVKMCKKMKESETLRNIPIIFLSAIPDDMVALTSLEAGGDRFMSKPVRLPILFETVGILLERYAFHRWK